MIVLLRTIATLSVLVPLVSQASGEEFQANKTEIRAWVLADANEDGALAPDEFRLFVQAMAKAGQSTAELVTLFGMYETAFSVADANGDGRITPQELRSADNDYRESEDR